MQDVPDLRNVDDVLRSTVKARQGQQKADWNVTGFWDHKRPAHLFSGLMRCGVCDGGIVNLNGSRLGCANARNKGTCNNRRTMRRVQLGSTILTARRDPPMEPNRSPTSAPNTRAI